jgi:hypothetical protein
MNAQITSTPTKADHAVWDLAQENTIQILKRHGNIVSRPQWQELHKVLESFVYTIALPGQRRRLAFPLPCGAGKTTAVRGFCKAIYELRRPYKIVICAEKIEALCELKQNLVGEDGIPESLISLLHSYDHDPDFNVENPKPNTASEPSDSDELDDLRQFVLLSHSKLHHGFNKMPYDLLIYDESLILGEGSTIRFGELLGEIGKFTGRVDGLEHQATQHQKALAEWLGSARELLLAASSDDLLEFPQLPITIEEVRKADRAINGRESLLRNFIGLAHDGHDMRLMKEEAQGSSIITVRQTIPDDMHNLAILDASYNIRKLMSYDKTIEAVSSFQSIKDHSDVTVYLTKANAGRTSIMAGLQGGGDTKLFHEVAERTARLLKAGRKVLVFTFKDNGPIKPITKLKELIRYYLGGTDPDMLSTGGDLNFLTWGCETATNGYSHCDAVIFAGLLTLPNAAVAGKVFAHARDINLELTSEEFNEVVQSEKVHSLYQALSRGSCRVMMNGKAKKMDAYIFSHDYIALKKALGVAMPGVRFVDYQPKHLKTKTTKKDEAKIVFTKVLDGYKGATLSIKQLYGHAPKIGTDTKKTALDELLEDVLVFDWKREGRSLIRLESSPVNQPATSNQDSRVFPIREEEPPPLLSKLRPTPEQGEHSTLV